MLPLLNTYDFEGAAPEVHAWHAYVLAGLDRRDEALEILEQVTEQPPQWPHIKVRTLLAQGQAHINRAKTPGRSARRSLTDGREQWISVLSTDCPPPPVRRSHGRQ